MDEKNSQFLIKFKQEHILRHLDIMTEIEKLKLMDEIRQIDLKQASVLYETYMAEHTDKKKKKIIQEAGVLSFNQSETSKQYRKRLHSLGEDYLSQGRVAVFLVAGGQGTRLGFKGPKGCYPISPVKSKSLFQLFAETVKATQIRYGNCIHWYIMTSLENTGETRNFFIKNNFFGLKTENIHFLVQKQIPSVDLNGKIIITRDKKIFKNPDGHGGALSALHDSGALKEMAEQGIDEIFYFQVDNPLAKIADPLFVGAHVEHQSEMSSKVVQKTDPAERVGIIGKVDGKLGCIEYSELSQDETAERIKGGSLRFSSANIAIHMLNRNFVEKLCVDNKFSLPYHTAIKEIECLDIKADAHTPNKIKGIKFEMFIFDALRFAKRSVTLEVSRQEEFSPVKNKAGADSAETARSAMISLHTKWLKDSSKAKSIADNFIVEISPLYALDEQSFREKFTMSGQIASPLYLE